MRASTPEAMTIKNPTQFVTLLVLALTPAYSQAPRFHPDITADTTTGNRVIPHLASGGGWHTNVALFNLGSTTANYTVRFYGDSGAPQAFPFKNNVTGQELGTQSILTGQIPVGGLVLLNAENADNATTTGWALIDPASTGDIGALAIFNFNPTGQQATVPAETSSAQRFVLGYGNSGGETTGVALANPHANPVTVNLVVRDPNGATLASDQFMMTPHQHMSFLLPTRYPAASAVGTILISTDSTADAVAGVAILANSAGAYTTLFAITAQ